MEKEDNARYEITVTRKQLQLLSEMCDNHSRNICGQLSVGLMPYIRRAVHKEHPEYDWSQIRQTMDEATQLINRLSKLVWGMENGASHGIGYDEGADVLFDIHQVIRHHLWKEKPEPKEHYTNDAFDAVMFGTEPKIEIRRIDKNK